MASDSDKKEKDEAEKGLFGEALKKVFTAGVSAAFMTEESLRAYLAELKLPKEILNLLIQSAARSKDEITTKVTKEAIAMLHKIDFAREFSKFAETHKFRVTAEIDIIKKEVKSNTSTAE